MPEYIYALLIAVPLGLVSFVSAFWGGIYRCLCFSELLKMIFAFTIFQAGMFSLGAWSGGSFANSIGWLSIPFAEVIIFLTGVKLIYFTIRMRPEQKSYNLAKNGELIAVSFASGLNAFMLGLGLGLLRPFSDVKVIAILPAVILFSYFGNYMGKRQGRIFYVKFAGIISGIICFLLAVVLALDFYALI